MMTTRVGSRVVAVVKVCVLDCGTLKAYSMEKSPKKTVKAAGLVIHGQFRETNIL